MDIESILQNLQTISTEKFVKFVADNGSNSCEKCLKYHGQIFKESDPDKPELPIHPNCRCRYEDVSSSEFSAIQEKIRSIANALRSYAQQIAAKERDLQTEAEELLKQAKEVSGKAATLLNSKISSAIVEIQYALTADEKIKITASALDQIVLKNQLNLSNTSTEIAALLCGNALKNYLKDLHYSRLYEPEQRPENLPRNAEEALKRGFVLAPDNQNRYHRHKGQKENKKYYHPVTGQEVVFGKNGKRVTSPENIGTKNYIPNPMTVGHVVFDILPYWIWGNSADDTTPLKKRIWGTGNSQD